MSTQADRPVAIAGPRGRLVAVRRPRAVTAAALLVTVGAVIAAVSLLLDALGGTATFVTHPVSVIAQGGSAVGVALLAARRAGLGDRRGGWWMLALAAALLGYLALGAVATRTAASASPAVVAVVVGLWSVWWAVPSTLVQLAALDAAGLRRRSTAAIGALVALMIGLAAFVTDSVAPFAGVAPAAPGAWRSSGLLDALTIVQGVIALAIPVGLAVRAVRLRRVVDVGAAARRRPRDAGMRSHSAALLLAAAAAIPPLLVVVCIGLAIARDPGAVDPAVGSVGYLVALSTGCLLAAGCLGAVRPASPAVVGRLIAGVLGGYALVALVIAATLLGSALAPAGPLAVALVGIVATALAAAAWWIAWRRLLAGIAANEPAPASAPRFAMLSPREHEVLALLADGARDAEIAARLHLSERTVESHLNRVFAKLGLDAADGRNRRILAVRAWAESGAPAPPANGLREKPDTAAGPIGRA